MSYGLDPVIDPTGSKYILTVESGATQSIGTTGYVYFVNADDVINLPAVSTGRMLLFIKNNDTYTYTLVRNGSDTINSAASNFTIGLSVLLVGNGTDWVVLAATGY
jgi:hypothetical protein